MKNLDQYTDQELTQLITSVKNNIEYRFRQGMRENDYDRQLILDPGYFILFLKEIRKRLERKELTR